MENIKISNFRIIEKTWVLDIAPITFFTGTNNSGKSTILKAMLLLEDFVKSNNHFELNFNGANQRKHKIDSFSNSVNRVNRSSLNLDIKLEFTNKDHHIMFVFKPMDIDDGIISKGKLKKLEISTIKNEKFIIENTASDDYILKLDLNFLSDDIKEDSDKKKLEDLALIETNKNLLEFDQIELEQSIVQRQNFSDIVRNNELNKSKQNENSNSNGIRLNKLMRDFNISLDRAIEYLASKGVEIDASPNAKIGIEAYKLLEEEFALDFLKKSETKIVRAEFAVEKMKYFDKKIIDLNNKINDGKKRIADLKRKINSQEVKGDKIILMPEFSLSDFHNDYLTIDSVIRKILPNYLVEEQSKYGNVDRSIELKKALKFSEEIREILRFSVDHLSPHRNTQSRLYINNNMTSDINEVIRDHAENPISKTSNAGTFLKKWMKVFDIGQDFKIKQIEGVATQIEITDNGLNVNLADKGFGAGQVFTILLKIALVIDIKEDLVRTIQKGYRRKGFEEFSHTILIEEPESNLHPALQVELPNLLYYTYNKYGIKFILETHSEYVLRRSQVLVKEHYNQKIDKGEAPFKAYYFGKEGPYSMEYNKDGKFSNEFGAGFFDVSTDLAFDIL